MSRAVGFYRCSKLATKIAKRAAKDMPVVVLGSIYTKGVTPETPMLFLYDEFDPTSVRGGLATVDTERAEKEMQRAMLPYCPPVLLRLPRAVPKMLAAIKADRERVLVVVDSLPGPSVTSQLMLMACDAVVVSFDGTRESYEALRLFLHLVSSWLKQYSPILRSHRPRIVVFATRPETSASIAEDLTSRLFPSAVVVAGPRSAALVAHLASF
jgi:hypothetical protein